MASGGSGIWVWLIVAIGITIAAIVMAIFRHFRRDDEREEDRILKEEIATGKRLPDGRLACIICGDLPAKHRLPTVGVSLFERANPLRDLYGTVQLYRRVEDDENEVCVCSGDRDLYASLIDDQLAEIRRLSAQFRMAMNRRVSRIKTGELILVARKERSEAIREIEAVILEDGPASPPLLTRAFEDEVAVSSSQTTNGKSRKASEDETVEAAQ